MQIFQLIRYTALIVIGIILAKSGMQTAEIGQYETFLLISGAISFFWLNGVIQGLLPSAGENTVETKSPFLFNAFYLIASLAILSALFILVFESSISAVLLKGSPIPYLKYLIIYILISAPVSLVEYIYLIYKRTTMIVVYGTISFFSILLFVGLPAILSYTVEICLLGLIMSTILRLIWLLVLLFRYSTPGFDYAFFAKHLKNGSPIILSLFLSGSAQYIDGFIITAYFDDASFAVFRYGAREFPLVLLLANAFSSSMLPEFGNPAMLNENLRKIKHNSLKLAKWLFPLSGALMLVSHALFPIIFNISFSNSATIFNIYLLLIVSRLLFPQTILIGLQKNKPLMWVSAVEIGLNVALSISLVRICGIAGVAYGTVIAYVVEKLLLLVMVKKTCGISVTEYLSVKQHLVYSLLLSVLFVFIEFVIY